MSGIDIACKPAVIPIVIGLNNLLRRESSDPEVAWEIRLFQFIILDDDPEARALEYSRARHLWEGAPAARPKREVVKALGWVIQ